MNEPARTRQTGAATLPPATAAAWAWPKGHRLGGFELQEIVACSSSGIVYRAWDHALAVPVAIKEYLPVPLAVRTADGRVAPLVVENAASFERGLQAFVDETRKLAQCDHPALVRMLHLLQLHDTAYRVMPWYAGQTLIDVRRAMPGPPNEAWLRSLLDNLLGALDAYHRVGRVHGALHPAQIMLLSGDRALLLGPAAAQRALAGASAQAAIDHGFAPREQTSSTRRPGPWTDFYALAQVARYCITGMMPPLVQPAIEEPLAATVQRLFFDMSSVRYSDALLRTLDAALSPAIAERPQTVARFREGLDGVKREGLEAQERAEAEALRLIQRAVASLPSALPAPAHGVVARPGATARGDAPAWAEIAGERDATAVAPPRRRRHALGAATVVATLGLAALVAWPWREHLLPPRVATTSSLPPAARAPASAAGVAAAPEATAAPAPVLDAPPTQASEPEAAPPITAREAEPAPPVDERIESAATLPAVPAEQRPVARAESPTPRALCGRRSNFSLYRCMQQQCSQSRWAGHAQCLRLKATDRVD